MNSDDAPASRPTLTGQAAAAVTPRASMTVVDLLLLVENARSELPRRREMATDLRALARLMPETAGLQATRRIMHPHLKRLVLSAETLGVSRKRAANIKSNVKKILAWHEGGGGFVARSLSAEWTAVREMTAGRRWTRAALAGLMGWCSDKGVSPREVTSGLGERFLEHLLLQCPVSDARRRAAMAIKAWNEMRTEQPGWPPAELDKLASIRKCVTADAFSAAFLADLQLYVDAITGKSAAPDEEALFSEEDGGVAPLRKPRRATTAGTRRQCLRRAAVRLAKARGAGLKSIVAVAELLAPGAPRTILRAIHAEKGHGPELVHTVQALMDAAKWHAPSGEDTLRRIRNVRKHVVFPERKMTEKNRQLLYRITPTHMATLHQLPKMLMGLVEERLRNKKRLRPSDIMRARAAVCLAILLYTPLRISNLIMIRVGQHLLLPGRQGDAAVFAFTAAEMKGDEDFNPPVNPRTLPTLLWYLRRVRPLLPGDPSIVFPGRSGPVRADSVRKNIQKALEEHLGFSLNPHFFRHLVAHMHLVRHPKDYSSVQALLGHKDLETTVAYYCGAEARAVLDHIARCLAEAADEIEAGASPQAGRRRPASVARRAVDRSAIAERLATPSGPARGGRPRARPSP